MDDNGDIMLISFDSYDSRHRYGIGAKVDRFEIIENDEKENILYLTAIYNDDKAGAALVKRYWKYMKIIFGINFRIVGQVLRFDVDMANKVVNIEIKIDWDKTIWKSSNYNDDE